tara:strand:+ start:293 stop:526 length:234 start_codon:yes stop_codon:yes gene_type:complete
MSSTANRRFKRQKERDFKKGKIEEYLKIPTEQDVEEYILDKKKENEQLLKNLGGNDFDNIDDFFINPVTPIVYAKVK